MSDRRVYGFGFTGSQQNGEGIYALDPESKHMECPRCEAELVTYRLEGVTAVVCESCGYADVPAELDVEPREDETWEEAFERFRSESG